jgi:hypothetical protein
MMKILFPAEPSNRSVRPMTTRIFCNASARYDTGDYDWAIISDWMVNADGAMNASSPQRISGVRLPLTINSAYRNPCKEWRIYLQNGENTPHCSLHPWGRAIDYGIFHWSDYTLPVKKKDWKDLEDVALTLSTIIPN